MLFWKQDIREHAYQALAGRQARTGRHTAAAHLTAETHWSQLHPSAQLPNPEVRHLEAVADH